MVNEITCPCCGTTIPIPVEIAHDAQKWRELKTREAERKRNGRVGNPRYAQPKYTPKSHSPGKPGRCLCGMPVESNTIMAADGETATCTRCAGLATGNWHGRPRVEK